MGGCFGKLNVERDPEDIDRQLRAVSGDFSKISADGFENDEFEPLNNSREVITNTPVKKKKEKNLPEKQLKKRQLILEEEETPVSVTIESPMEIPTTNPLEKKWPDELKDLTQMKYMASPRILYTEIKKLEEKKQNGENLYGILEEAKIIFQRARLALEMITDEEYAWTCEKMITFRKKINQWEVEVKNYRRSIALYPKTNSPQMNSTPHHVEENDENNMSIKRIPHLSPNTLYNEGNAVVNKFSSMTSYEELSPPAKIHDLFATNLENNNNKKPKVSFSSSVNEEEEDGILRIRQECDLCEKKSLSALSPRVLYKTIEKIRNHEKQGEIQLALTKIEDVFILIRLELSELTDEEYNDSLTMIIDIRKFYNKLKKRKENTSKLTLVPGTQEATGQGHGLGHHRKTTSMFTLAAKIDLMNLSPIAESPQSAVVECPCWWKLMDKEQQEQAKAAVIGKKYTESLVAELADELGFEIQDSEEFCQWWFFRRYD